MISTVRAPIFATEAALSLIHEKGPIVRITPWQLSIRDPSYYNQLYVAGSTRRTDMWARGREGSGFQGTFRP